MTLVLVVNMFIFLSLYVCPPLLTVVNKDY